LFILLSALNGIVRRRARLSLSGLRRDIQNPPKTGYLTAGFLPSDASAGNVER